MAGGALIATRPFWPTIAAWFSGMFATPVLATIAGALYPSTAGGSVQTHEIAGTGHTVKINGDMTVGEVYDSEGNPTGISVIASGTDSNGSLVGFTPLTEQDAQGLGSLLGSDIGTENVLKTVLNSESADDTSSTDEPGRTSGSNRAIAQETGMTEREVKDAIHDAKPRIPKGIGQKNPDVVVDLDTGEIHPVANDGTVGGSIGNIYD